MPAAVFHAGETCYCRAAIVNPGPDVLNDVKIWVLLEVGGQYFYAPDFSQIPSWMLMNLSPGTDLVEVIPPFSWPDHAGAFSARFHGAMTDSAVTRIIGTWETLEFDWE